MKFRKLILMLVCVSGFAFGDNRVESISLDEESKVATVCATVKVFIENENFSHKDYSGWVITISGDEAIFKGLKPSERVCVFGPYTKSSKGFAPHLTITDVKLKSDSDVVADKLDKKSELLKVVTAVNTEWGDRNISTGTTRVRGGVLKKVLEPSTYQALSEKNFREEMEFSDEALPAKTKLTTDAHPYSKKGDLSYVVKALAEGNDYAPENKQDRLELQKDVEKLLAELGKSAELVTLVTTAKINISSDEEGDKRNAYSILIANKETKQAIRIFVIQGQI